MKLFVVIPTYNEKNNIRRLIPSILDNLPDAKILIVDDNSPDNTGEEVKRLAEKYHRKIYLLSRTKQRGRGSAGIDGFKLALQKGADAVVEMDADFSHHPRHLKLMVEALRNNDVVVGSRFLHGGKDQRPVVRTLITVLGAVYIRQLLNIKLTDPTSGFRIFKKKVLEDMNLDSLITSQSWAVVQEMLYKSALMGFKTKEVPIVFKDRKKGKSKFNYNILLQTMLLVLVMRLEYSKIWRDHMLNEKKIKSKTKIICPNCKKAKSKKLRELSSNFIYKCPDCNFGFQYPPPSNELVEDYYNESIYPRVWGSHERSFARMKNLTYQNIFSYLPRAKGDNLLDIGTGYGFCLAVAKRHGYIPIGIEPSKQLAEIARKISGAKVLNQYFEKTKLKENSFKVATMFDVIEHIQDPWTALIKAAKRVSLDGYLVITTPDFGSFSAKALGKYWFHLKDEHYYYFTSRIIEKAVSKESMKTIVSRAQKRPITVEYIQNHLEIYPIPFLSSILEKAVKLLPPQFKNKVFTVFDGNLLIILQKIK